MNWRLSLVPIEFEASLPYSLACLETNKPKLSKTANRCRKGTEAGHLLVHFGWRQGT